MIPVQRQPEPPEFDLKVRQPGLKWLKNNHILASQAPPEPSKLPNYWSHTQQQLWTAYNGICAYLSIYFAWPLGAHSTDHFIAKSRLAGDVYEWNNYRLSCLGMNRNKNRFDDILDPFQIQSDTFILDLSTGNILPNPHFTHAVKNMAAKTIKRLKLDAPDTNEMRAKHYEYYLKGDVSENYLKENSPFVWHEAKRQGLL